MAKKKTKFPLTLKNDVEVRTLDELHEHFDLEKIIGYFQDGRLLTWLNARDYENEAKEVEALDKADGNIGAKLCRIFGIKAEKSVLEKLDAESIKFRNERIARLKQHTDDKNVIENVDRVAFDQKELGELLDNGVSEIYLCDGKFTIPIKQKNKTYTGIGKVEVAIKSKKAVDFEALGISFVNVKFDEKFALPTKPTADALLEIANEAATEEDYARAKEYWQKAAEAGNSDAMYALGNMYREGLGVKKDDKQAVEWLKKAIKNDNIAAMLNVGEMYANGEGVRKNRQQAVKLFERAATMGNTDAAYKLGYMYYKGEGVTQDFKKAKELLKKAADNGAANAMFWLGVMYRDGVGVEEDLNQALEWFQKAADAGDEHGKEALENLNQFAHKEKSMQIFSSHVVAELLGVFVHGRLKNGQSLWNVNHTDYRARFIKFRELEEKDTESDDWWLKSTWMIDRIEEYNESIIGLALESNFIDDWEYIVFTERAVYFQDTHGRQYREPYTGMVNVLNDPAWSIKFIHTDGDSWLMPSSGKWDKDLGLENLRLFFLVMAKVLGNECEYVFDDNEIEKLKMVKLKSLDGKCILDYL